jgi:multidrug efflux pump subunit AcrB
VRDVEQMVAGPAEQVLAQISGVEHVMSVSRPGWRWSPCSSRWACRAPRRWCGCTTRCGANADWLPGPGVLEPIIKPKGIDDVPIVTLTLFSKNPDTGPFDLERVAHSIEGDLKRVPGTREVRTVGGPGRAVMVEIDPARMASTGVTVADLRQRAAVGQPGHAGGRTDQRQPAVAVEAGPFLARPATWPSWWWRARRQAGVPARRGRGARRPPAGRRYVWHGKAEGRAGGRIPRGDHCWSPRSRARTPSTWPTP